MGFLDDPRVFPFASDVFASIADAESQASVQLSPIAREIVALFMVAPAFESPSLAEAPTSFDSSGVELTGKLREQLPGLLEQTRAAYSIGERFNYRNLITTADVYHFLAELAQGALASLSWPYPKD